MFDVRSSARRVSRLIIVAAVAMSAVLALSSTPASAGATAPPPTRGDATYNLPKIVTTCASGVPTKVTFSFRYDATKLRRGYSLKVFGYVGDPTTLDQRNLAKQYVFIRPGTHRLISRTFAVPSVATARWQVGLWAQTRHPQSDYRYAQRYARLSCTNTVHHGLIAGKASFGKVNCRHIAHLTFDNSNGNTAWGFTVFYPGGGFAPSEHVVSPGQIYHRTVNDVHAGDVMSVDMSNSAGALYGGKFRLAQGC